MFGDMLFWGYCAIVLWVFSRSFWYLTFGFWKVLREERLRISHDDRYIYILRVPRETNPESVYRVRALFARIK